MSIAMNYAEVKSRMEAACVRAGRDPKEVTLIAVSKTKPVSMLMEAYEAGARTFGENKVQEITEKFPQMPEDAKFHMIGHLQTNKVGQVIEKAVLIHSVDSVHLAEKIEKEAEAELVKQQREAEAEKSRAVQAAEAKRVSDAIAAKAPVAQAEVGLLCSDMANTFFKGEFSFIKVRISGTS